MLLILLRARKNDPIKAETIVNYLESYIEKAKIIKKKVKKEITFAEPEEADWDYEPGHGTVVNSAPMDGFFRHEVENVNFILRLWSTNYPRQ